jgi:glycopeptide antibiotics resistance protein
MSQERRIRKRDLFGATLILYVLVLSTFVLFPRPVLESGDPSQISEFLQTHANFFYKILYADTRVVALGNFLMLTPFPIIYSFIFPKTSLRKIFLLGTSLSATFEIIQMAIPGRVSDFVDFLSNSLSVLIGLAIVRFLRRRLPAEHG